MRAPTFALIAVAACGNRDPQRPLIDRTIANMRAQEAARERDPVKACPLHVAASRDTISLLEAMSAADPDNVDTRELGNL